jgi:acetate kinase
MTAVKFGKSIDTSMGFTPNEGLIMGTRSGDLDIGVITYIMQKEEIGISQIVTLVNKQSGILGVSGISSDMREVEEAAFSESSQRAILSLDMYHYRIKKYLGAYAAAMGGVDMVIFAGGVGENAPETREAVCKDMEFLGISLDISKNNGLRAKEQVISTADSKVKVMVVPTNEELVIAEDTQRIVSSIKEPKRT